MSSNRIPTILGVLTMLLLTNAPSAEAMCNLIPPIGEKFASSLGSVNQRVATPGSTVRIFLTECDPPSARFSPTPKNNVVTLEFEPPTGSTTTVTVPTANVDPVDAFCTLALCTALDVTIPSTTGLAGAYGLTGPVRIRVVEDPNGDGDTSDGTESANIFQLAVPGKGCARGVEGVFETFTILPPPNDFQQLANGSATEILATLDGTGSLLIPFDYRQVLVPPGAVGSPIARLIKASMQVDAFPGTPGLQPITVPSSRYVRSFTIDGRPLPPLLRIDDTGHGLVGTVDGDIGILRLTRDDPNDVQGPLFDLVSRMIAGKGPIVIDVGAEVVTADATETVPLRGLRPSSAVVAYARDEAKEGPGGAGQDLNGDGDTKDRVVQVLDPHTGTVRNVAAATSEVRTSGLGVPAIEADGDLAAFLESEAAQNFDHNGDGDRLDTRLRVFRATGSGMPADLTPGPTPQLADGAPVINRRSLAISNGMVFFREPSSSSPTVATEMVSVDSSGNEATAGGGAADSGFEAHDAAAFSISNDGRYVAFQSLADNLHAPDPSGLKDVYVHDRSTGDTELVSVSSSEAACGSGSPSAVPAISGDGQRVVFTTNCTDLVPGGESGLIVVRDRSLGETWALTQVGFQGVLDHLSPAISADGHIAAFASKRADLIPGDGNGSQDVFVVDVDACRTGPCVPERVSVDSDGLEHVGLSDNPALSADGRFVAFESIAGLDSSACPSPPCPIGGQHVFVHDRQTKTTRAVDVLADGFVSGSIGESPSISADGRFVSFDSRTCTLTPEPCNSGQQYEIYVRDLLLGVTERVSLDLNGDAPNDFSAFSSISADGRFVAFSSRATDLVPEDGTPGRDHIYLYDRATGSTERIDVAAPVSVEADAGSLYSRISADGQTVVFTSAASNLTTPAEAFGGDLDVFVRGPASGTTVSRVLKVFRPSMTPDVVPESGIPAAAAAVAGGRALVLPPDGSNVRLFAAATDTLQTLDVPGVRVALSEQVLAITTPAAPFDLLHVRDVAGSGATTATSIAAHDIAVAGRDVVIASPVDESPSIDSNLDGTSDNDADVHVLRVLHFEPPTQALIEVGWPVTDLEVDADATLGHLVAFRTSEAEVGTDLNGDADLLDHVMQIYDRNTSSVIQTGQAAIRCELPGCEPGRLYQVRGNTVSFLTRESDQGGTDLNGNDQANDTVVQVFNTVTGKSQVFDFTSSDGKPPAALPGSALGGSVLYQTVNESELKPPFDLNGDWDTVDDVILVVGDQDEDGVFDASRAADDICVEATDEEQLDSDLDEIGDVCDQSAYCTTYAPPAPPMPAAAACQRALASAAQTYVKKRIVAQRACYKKIADGKLAGDPRELCRGSFVGELEILPRDGDTAEALTKAATKMSAGFARSCSPEASKLALLDVCDLSGSPTIASVTSCLKRTHGEAANVLAELSYGALAQIPDAKGRRCQLAIADAGSSYLNAILRTTRSCLDKWGRGRIVGDPAALCLGSRDQTLGLNDLPDDTSTDAALGRALARITSRLERSCAKSGSLLAARSACGTDTASVTTCIECAQWRRAVDLLQTEYGPN